MSISEFVVKRIYEICDTRRLSPTRLARLATLPPSTIKNIVNGASRNPSIVTIKKICDGVDISIIDFFDTDDYKAVEQEIN